MRKYYPERSWSVPLAQWPAEDRRLWEAALKPMDIFEDESIAAKWSPRTRQGAEDRYGRWLAWLTQQGLLKDHQPPGERMTPERLLRFISDLKGAPVSKLMYVSTTRRVLQAIAPSTDWDWMLPICRQLKRAAIPVREKHTRVVDSAALYALGIELIDAAGKHGPQLQATRARDGLIISLLAARPLRMGNLTTIELGRHLQWTGESYWLVFDRAETKNGRPIETHCPDELVPHIHRYLEFFRPQLLAGSTPILDTRRLWINRNGKAMAEGAIRRQIVLHTHQAFGWAINPHLFRDCAATSIAIRDPEHVRIASVILGHNRQTTTERYYNQARMLTAAREHTRAILALRKRARSTRS